MQVSHGSLVAGLWHGEVQGQQLGAVAAALLAALTGLPTRTGCSSPAAGHRGGCSAAGWPGLLVQVEQRNLAGAEPCRQHVLLGRVPGQRRDLCRRLQHRLWVDGIAVAPNQRTAAASHRHRHHAAAGGVEARRRQRTALAVQQVGEGLVLHQARRRAARTRVRAHRRACLSRFVIH